MKRYPSAVILLGAVALWGAARGLLETRPRDARPSMERADEDRRRLDRGDGPLQNYGDTPARSDAGVMTISPDGDVRVRERGTWTLTFDVGPSGLEVSDGLLVYIPHGWSGPLTLEQGFPSQLRYNGQIEKATSTSAGLCTATASNPATEIRLFSTWKDQTRMGEGLCLWVAVEGAPLKEGDWIRITYGDRRYGGPGALSAYFASQFEFNTLAYRQMDWEKFGEGVWTAETGGRLPRYIGLLSAAKEAFYVARPPRIRTVGWEPSRFFRTGVPPSMASFSFFSAARLAPAVPATIDAALTAPTVSRNWRRFFIGLSFRVSDCREACACLKKPPDS